MPYLDVVHVRELRCPQCNALLATAGARSFIVDENGSPVSFLADDPPAAMLVEFMCPSEHVCSLTVPGQISAEETMTTPDDAPIAADARLVSATSETGRAAP